jgi:hypothetical protein
MNETTAERDILDEDIARAVGGAVTWICQSVTKC